MTKEMDVFGNDEYVMGQTGTGDKSKGFVFGIDLGTTNSAISVVIEDNTPETIKLSNGKYTMPSCVMWTGKEFIVGDKAYENRHLPNVAYSIKTHMNEVGYVKHFAAGPEGGPIDKTAVEVSAEILKGLVKMAGTFYGEIKRVVVTVPAYFNDTGRQNTKAACELAGLEVIKMINEPTAASLLLHDKKDMADKKLLVYDLGGGTFDITLLKVTNTHVDNTLAALYGMSADDVAKDKTSINVIGSQGDTHLGGDNLDAEIIKEIQKLVPNYNLYNLTDECYESLKHDIENAKKSDMFAARDWKLTLTNRKGKTETVELLFGETQFRAATRTIFNKTKALMDKLFKEVGNEDIDGIVLVGGSTKNQILQEMLVEEYGLPLLKHCDPDKSVSQGAALDAKITEYGDENIQVFDVLTHAIGVLSNGKVDHILPRSCAIPSKKTYLFTTTYDNQTVFSVVVYQGNSSIPDNCVELASFRIEDITPKPAGEPDIAITLAVDASSMLSCTAEVDGISKSVTVNLSGGGASDVLSDKELLIQRLKKGYEIPDDLIEKFMNDELTTQQFRREVARANGK